MSKFKISMYVSVEDRLGSRVVIESTKSSHFEIL